MPDPTRQTRGHSTIEPPGMAGDSNPGWPGFDLAWRNPWQRFPNLSRPGVIVVQNGRLEPALPLSNPYQTMPSNETEMSAGREGQTRVAICF